MFASYCSTATGGADRVEMAERKKSHENVLEFSEAFTQAQKHVRICSSFLSARGQGGATSRRRNGKKKEEERKEKERERERARGRKAVWKKQHRSSGGSLGKRRIKEGTGEGNETLPFLATSISSSVQREVSPVSPAPAKKKK